MITKAKKLYDDAILPSKATVDSAGWDVHAYLTSAPMDENGVRKLAINPGEVAKISIGWAMAIPSGYEGEIRPRSGLATKKGLRPANTPGTIDAKRKVFYK